jgi:hypothetical protein
MALAGVLAPTTVESIRSKTCSARRAVAPLAVTRAPRTVSRRRSPEVNSTKRRELGRRESTSGSPLSQSPEATLQAYLNADVVPTTWAPERNAVPVSSDREGALALLCLEDCSLI